VIGILLAKELLKYALNRSDPDQFNIMDNLRRCLYVPESRRLDSLLKEFRLSHNHMAIVVDEYGGISGLVTIEDILEQIVGDIEDEYDLTEQDLHPITPIGNGIYQVAAATPIETFNTYFQTQFSDAMADTLGGLILQKLGYVPKIGEQVVLTPWQFEIKKASTRRIHQLHLSRLPTPNHLS
jgi:magnesium and cobalt transporter